MIYFGQQENRLHGKPFISRRMVVEKRKILTKQLQKAPVKQTLQKIVDSKNQFGGLERQQTLIAAVLQDAIAS
jgi:hypothetical protein